MIPKFSQKFPSLSSCSITLYIDIILQYWKMKRTSNFGLPLIKVVTQDTIEEIQQAHRNDILRLRVHLERIRNLSYMICRREKIKRSWLSSHREIVQLALSLATNVHEQAANGSSYRPLHSDQTSRVPDDMVCLARKVISSNNIYNQESEGDKSQVKRVIKELNRLSRMDQLRKRSPNPYEKKYLKGQLKRREQDDDLSDSQSSPHKTTPTKINGSKVNGSSLLVRSPGKSPLSPAKTPSSSENLKSCSLLIKSPLKSHHKHRDPQSLLRPVVSTRSADGKKSRKILHTPPVIKSEDSLVEEADEMKQVCCLN